MIIGYYAVFNYNYYKKIKYGISINFPDVEGAYTCADNIENGKKFAKEVLELVTCDLKVKDLPKVSTIKEIQLNSNEEIYWIEYETTESEVERF
ncbi:hypothetical protein VLK81_03390 [Citroniella saccharovorans]|uniref:HicB-like antitoxin of toxin-antitoxin system domain-containing protein n=1 Tax=Citroniella saccharovorans TaxID=2053367 RepID=A0AAW9MVU9_9FIRM|nr:hypothetical protein [Citroniella saccharovorans]MEB3429073.1 hypothetical protein [Citroniella saccharovorans]